MSERLVVIGGGAAGMSAASAARRIDPALAITVLEASPHASYGVCGIPYYLSGVIPRPETLIARTPEEFRERRRIDLRLQTSVASIDVAARTVALADGERLPFDNLVMATGASPIVPALPGVDNPRVVTIRRLDDAIALRHSLRGVRRAVVVGAGYVGLEMAESLHSRGIDVTVVDRLSRVMASVDEQIAAVIEEEVRRHAEVLLGRTLTGIGDTGHGLEVELDGERVATDLVVLALGVRPGSALLEGSGAKTTAGSALLVDDRMRTSLPGVLAAGDCIAPHHRVTNAPAYVPLGPAANKTGRVAGIVAAGGDASFSGIVGTAVVKVFDLTVAHTGLTVVEATSAGFSAVATDITANSRAKYYPGAEPLRVRLVHTPDGLLLGAQLVGRDGAAQRIDVVAAALHSGQSVDDLAAFDLAYAPPFSPVYDPLTQAAQAAQYTTMAKVGVP